MLEQQEKEKADDVALVRLEQFYPLPYKQLEALRKKYTHATEWVWVQDEPENMGPWPFVLRKLRQFPFEVISRKESASPATGYKKAHLSEQKRILDTAFAVPAKSGKNSK